jgi:hypothetical protein
MGIIVNFFSKSFARRVRELFLLTRLPLKAPLATMILVNNIIKKVKVLLVGIGFGVARIIHAGVTIGIEINIPVTKPKVMPNFLTHHCTTPLSGVVIGLRKVIVIDLGVSSRDMSTRDPDPSNAEPPGVSIIIVAHLDSSSTGGAGSGRRVAVGQISFCDLNGVSFIPVVHGCGEMVFPGSGAEDPVNRDIDDWAFAPVVVSPRRWYRASGACR